MYKIKVFKNGIKLIVDEVKSVYSVSMGLIINSGSRSEDIPGSSHFVEHMLFKGTNKRTAQDIINYAENLGIEFSASTGKEVVSFKTRFLKEYLENAFDLLSDILFCSVLPEKEIELERSVILEEINLINDVPDNHIDDNILKFCLGEHPIVKPIIGNEIAVSNIDRNNLVKCYNKLITEEMIISISGNVDFEMVVEMVEKYFGKKQMRTEHCLNDKPTITFLDHFLFRDAKQAYYNLIFPGLAYNDKRVVIMWLLFNILGDSGSSRLVSSIRDLNGLAYTVGISHDVFSDFGLFFLHAGIKPENIERTGILMWDCIKEVSGKVKGKRIREDELNRAKIQIKASFSIDMESISNRMFYGALWFDSIIPGEMFTPQHIIDMVDNAKISDLEEFAREFFKEEYMSTVVLAEKEFKYNPTKN